MAPASENYGAINSGMEPGILAETTRLVPVSKLKEHPDNPRIGDVEAIKESIEANGFFSPLVVQKSTGRVLAGNHRLKAALELGMKKLPVAYVDVDAKAAKKILLADNRSSDFAGYDDDALRKLLGPIMDADALLGTLWTEADVRKLLLDGVLPEAPEPQTDKAEALQKKWGVERGQVWEVGKHRLMCDDCRDLKDELPIITDPPYGVDYEYESWDDSDEKENDELYRWLHDTGRPLVYFCGSVNLMREMERGPCKVLIWHKPWSMTHSGIGNGRHHWEPIIVRNKIKGAYLPSDVFTVATDRVSGLRDKHSCPKPVQIIAQLIEAFVPEGGIYDPFLGSGTTMVAAEQLGRSCHGVDIDTKYVAVVLERMADMGLKPKLSK